MGLDHSMLYKGSILPKGFARLALIALFFFAWIPWSLHRPALQTGAQSIGIRIAATRLTFRQTAGAGPKRDRG